jgi:hypothetical protein
VRVRLYDGIAASHAATMMRVSERTVREVRTKLGLDPEFGGHRSEPTEEQVDRMMRGNRSSNGLQ